MKHDLEAMRKAVVDGDRDEAARLARAAVEAGGDLLVVIDKGFAAGIRRVGDLWDEGEYFLPELVQGAEAMKAAMAVITPALSTDDACGGARAGTVVIGTVAGDLHDIGKSLVGTLLAAHGVEVHDLGADVSTATFVERALEVDADLVGASALLTTTMGGQRALVEALAAASATPPRVMVGGAPTSPAWAAEIGAHHAENALAAVALARELCS